MFRPLTIDEIGGGRVARKISMGGVDLPRGHELTVDQLRAIPTANRNSMIENRIIEVWPKQTRHVARIGGVEGGELMKFALGVGEYCVVRGSIVATGLSAEDADALIAGKPEPAAAPAAAPKPRPFSGAPARKAKRKSKPRPKRPAPPSRGGTPAADQNNGPV